MWNENLKKKLTNLCLVGGIVTNGPGLSFVEATAVTPEGRITPNDAGLWSDDQIDSLRQVTQYAHSQNQKIAIQLSHGGPKSSIATLWLPTAGTGIPASEGGWPDKVVAASPIPHDEKMHLPKEISKSEMAEIVVAFADAAKRAVTAGIDVIEIHGAHGFLINSFMSPQTNKRVDDYGGSFENRIRFPLEVVDAIRAVIPSTMPLFFRSVLLHSFQTRIHTHSHTQYFCHRVARGSTSKRGLMDHRRYPALRAHPRRTRRRPY
jgi:2,4-dienoyl-CoA reductase-like NADH-dependent reductase (Old Yellow Enzyme family)